MSLIDGIKPNVENTIQDWPENMKMDEETFAEYAKKLEFEDFEDEVRVKVAYWIGSNIAIAIMDFSLLLPL